MNLQETLKRLSDFRVKLVLHLEVPDTILKGRSYKYPFDNFCAVLSKEGKIFTSNNEVFYDSEYVLKRLPNNLEFKLDIPKINKSTVDTFNLNENIIFEASLDDVGHSDKIILVGITKKWHRRNSKRNLLYKVKEFIMEIKLNKVFVKLSEMFVSLDTNCFGVLEDCIILEHKDFEIILSCNSDVNDFLLNLKEDKLEVESFSIKKNHEYLYKNIPIKELFDENFKIQKEGFNEL